MYRGKRVDSEEIDSSWTREEAMNFLETAGVTLHTRQLGIQQAIGSSGGKDDASESD